MSASIESVSVDQAGGVTAELIAAITGKRIEVISFCLSVFGAVSTVKSTLQDTTANTVRATLIGTAGTATPVVYSFSGTIASPAFRTGISEGLELVTGAASAISGFINFRYI